MNYEEQVRAMVRHASQQHTEPQAAAIEMGQVVEALGKGVAIVAMGLPPQHVLDFLTEVATAIAVQTRLYQKEHGSAIDAHAFLRDVFKPEKFHG
ncbi:hypothetical protein UFOVP33_18 [uncultured Caudovirales phage]|uniref:Uncharacterized protein n=1 Tax=uncultured Caudovirales phage TaxID=2100421 RepID=A0A6J5KLA5_9CAUD|nr:hypothetical protein UFOVP33_18 [uncultured Caudovirales phage]